MDFSRFESAGYMINLCARLMTQRMAQALKPLGVAPAQLPVLFTLSARGESTQVELAERCAIEQPTMALTLRRMERDGLIERSPDPADRRRAIVRLTDHARGLLPEIESIADALNGVATAEIAGGGLTELLARVADGLGDAEAVGAVVASARAKHRTTGMSASA